ncbi:aggregation-promoting factor C-terminal-like domain-containing protein [Streptomyces sp. NPDC054784]
MAISVGSVEVDVVPNTRGIYQHLRGALAPAATRAGEDAGNAAGRAFGPAMRSEAAGIGLSIGQQIGSQIAARITAEIRGAVRDGVTQGGHAARPAATRQGSETGGAFARAARTRIEAAFRSLPDITIGADTSEADADLQALRARMEALAGRTIGVDIDAADARAQLEEIEAELTRLGAAHPDVTVRADTARARAELAAVRAEIDRISADPARIRVETDGSFGQRLRAQIQAAEASLPNINITADSSAADREIASLRARLTAMRDQRIGVDIDAAEARTQLTDIQARLFRLSGQRAQANVGADTGRAEAALYNLQLRLDRLRGSTPSVDVRVDTAAAAAQLGVVQAMVNRLDGQSATINVSTRQALRAVLQLAVAIGGLAAIPAVPILAAGIGSIAAAATAAGAGVGALAAVAAPAVKDIAGALQAQKAAQDAATTSTNSGGNAAAAAARKSLQQAGAQQALVSAHRNAARQIAQAEQGVQDAVRSAAQANQQAAEQVRGARQGLASAYEQAADRMRSAQEQVRSAEESLADAQRTARQAQQDLTQARRDAAAELEDLSNRLASAELSERDAVLSVQEARARLAAATARDSRASEMDRARAQLAYDQAVQRLREQQLDTKRLAKEKRAADKSGVDGTERVKSAQERLVAAQRGVAGQEAALGKARQAMSRQQIQNSRDIASAQEKVATAQRNVARVQEDGARSVARAQQQVAQARQSAAESIASAERQVASASLSSAGGADAAATAQAKYQAALAKLTPAARGTFDAFVQLRQAFGAWSRSLQPAVMPIFTRALNGMRKALPGLTPFVLAAADAIGELQDRASRGFKSPWWKTFKADLAGSVRPAIIGLGVAFGRIFKGMAGVVQAFLPHMDDISRKMQEVTGRFANWGTGLKGSPAFENFLSYAGRMGPEVASAIGDIAGAFWQVSLALEPLSGPVLEVLGLLARGVADLARDLPWVVQLLYLAWTATKLWALATAALTLAMKLSPLGRIIALVGLLVAAVVYAYKNFGWFRSGVQAAWEGIQKAASWAWNNVLKPVFGAIAAAAGVVAKAAMWLWRNAIAPAFRGIATVAKWLLLIIAVVVVGSIVLAFRLLAAVGRWLWRNALKPVVTAIVAGFRWLGRVGAWLYRNALAPALRGIATVARWLWNNALKPVFRWIADGASWLWRKGIKPPFDAIKKGAGLVAEAFRKARDGIGKAWAQIKELTRKPVKWVIDIVYNKGIRGLWNAAASVLPIKKLKEFKPKGFATGGPVWGPGTETSDSIPAVLSRNEHVWTAKEVRGAGGHAAVEAMRNAARKRGTAYAKGGAVEPTGAHGGIGDWVSGAIDWAGSKLGSAARALKNLALGGVYSAVKLASKPIRALIDRVPGGNEGWAGLVKAVPKGILDSLLTAVKGSEESQSGGGQWIKPVNVPYGTKFGTRGGMWASGRHTGLDFPAATGRTVKAVDQGSVAYARSGGPYGNHVLVSHGGGLASLYAHLSGISARSGPVKQGQTIGRVGATGNVTGPHLHLEARRKGVPVDPMPYLTGGGGGFGGRAKGRNQQIAQAMLNRYGWGANQFGPLKALWQHESGWNHLARNPSSGAYGIPQSLPASKMASAGSDWRTNPATQIKWGLGYIKGRYGSPAAAWSFWNRQSPHWYDSGGMLQPGLNLAYNATGRPEPVLTGSQWNAVMAQPKGGDGASVGDLAVSVFVGDREITDIVRTEIRSDNAQLAQRFRQR